MWEPYSETVVLNPQHSRIFSKSPSDPTLSWIPSLVGFRCLVPGAEPRPGSSCSSRPGPKRRFFASNCPGSADVYGECP